MEQINSSDIEKMFPIAETAINKALERLNQVIGVDDIEFEDNEVDPTYKQSLATFAFDFDFDAIVYNDTFPGSYDDSDFPCLNRNDAQEKQHLKISRLRDRHESKEVILERALTGVTGQAQIADCHVARHQYTCTQCVGAGEVTCSGCNGNGTYRCTSCLDGKPNCLHCYGKGRIAGGNNSWVTCTPCMGRGWHYCGTCEGTMQATCGRCSGHGANNCPKCNATGILTDFYGVRYAVTSSLTEKETKLIPAETKRLLQWIKGGFPGRNDKEHVRPEVVPVSIHAVENQQSGRKSHRMDFNVLVPQIVIDLNFEGRPANVRHILFEEPWVHFSPFLDQRVEKIATTVESHKDKAPTDILKALESYPAIHSSVKDRWASDPSFCGFKWSDAVSDHFYGAVSPQAIHPIMANYDASARRLQKEAVGNTIFMPMLAMAIIWVITQMMDFPGSIRSGLDQILVIPYVLIPFFVTRWMVKSKAQRVIKKATGQAADVKLGLRGHVVPIAAGLIFFLTWYLQFDLVAMLENVARATLSNR